MSVKLAESDIEISNCAELLTQLRPHLTLAQCRAQILEQMKAGYWMAYVERDGRTLAVAGCRFMQNLIWGQFCYVDDLVTDDKNRSTGAGRELMAWLRHYAQTHGSSRLELDSGVQRFDAHRFYTRERMHISCHHFSLELKAVSST